MSSKVCLKDCITHINDKHESKPIRFLVFREVANKSTDSTDKSDLNQVLNIKNNETKTSINNNYIEVKATHALLCMQKLINLVKNNNSNEIWIEMDVIQLQKIGFIYLTDMTIKLNIYYN